MKPEDYLQIGSSDPRNAPSAGRLRRDKVEKLRNWDVNDPSYLNAVLALVKLARAEFTTYGTGGEKQTRLTDDEIQFVVTIIGASLKRVSVDFSPPFIKFEEFKRYWRENDMAGSGGYQKRKECLAEFFDPVERELERGAGPVFERELIEPVVKVEFSEWQRVEEEINALRKQYRDAEGVTDYSAIGNTAVRVLEALAKAAYDEERHLGKGGEVIPEKETNNRFNRIIEVELGGNENESLRCLFKKAVAAAHSVKHGELPPKQNAAIVADTAILLTAIMRRLRE